MTFKSRLNTVVFLSITTVVVLFGFLFYTTWQISDELNQVERVNRFSKTATELNIISEQYLAYKESRYFEKWNKLYKDLQTTKSKIAEFPTRRVVSNALPSIKQAFELINDIYDTPEVYEDPQNRERLLQRATARIRSDIQLLLSASHRLEESHLQQVRDLQVNQRIQVLLILIPGIGFVIYLTFRMRKQTLHSLEVLLEGTKSIAEGNLDKQITIDGFEEYKRLARAFNQMKDELREHIESEQRLREEAEQNLELWEALVEQDPSLIVIHVQGEIKFINAAGIDILGAESAETVIGTEVFEYISEAEKSRAIEQIQDVEQHQQKISPTVYKVLRQDGEHHYLQIQSVPITYRGQQATQSVGVDVTDHINYEEELQESLEEKSVLLQEIHHRVKNNLAVISGMMHLQAMDSENKELTDKLRDSQLRIQSMASIHELLYDTESFSDLNFSKQIKKLVATISETLETNKDIEVNYQLEDTALNVNQAIPAALIVNELVTNAFKYAFEQKDKGTINIILKTNEGILTLIISDNGVGLANDFDIHNATTLGMRIIQMLCQQLDATIQYQRDNGSRFEIQFEMADVKGVGSTHLK